MPSGFLSWPIIICIPNFNRINVISQQKKSIRRALLPEAAKVLGSEVVPDETACILKVR
jgi:hypothetical protein